VAIWICPTALLVGWVLAILPTEDCVELGAGESWMFAVDIWIDPTMTDCDTTVVLGVTDEPGTWKIGLINVVINGDREPGLCCRMS